jgi:hypothetical protein
MPKLLGQSDCSRGTRLIDTEHRPRVPAAMTLEPDIAKQ